MAHVVLENDPDVFPALNRAHEDVRAIRFQTSYDGSTASI